MRHFLLIAAAGAVLSSAGQLAAALNDEIIPEAVAQRCGLTRVWVTQAQVNRGRGRLQTVLLYDGTLFCQSNRATLEAIDAETGQMLWSKMIGQPSHPTMGPGACRDLVATINGSTLFVMNRYNGDILWQTVVDGAPGGGPALSTARAYVPMVNGMVLAYRLEPVADAAKDLGKIDPHAAEMSDDEKKEAAKKAEEERRENIRIRQDYVPPLASRSTGRTLVSPVVTMQNADEEFISWVTDRGQMYIGRVDRRSADALIPKHKLTASGIFNNPPTFVPPNPKVVGDSGMVYGGSTGGYVYAMDQRWGELQWQFSTSDAVVDSPVVIEKRVYVTTELGGMFCLTADKGKQVWWAPDILHFVAGGKHRVYAADKLGRLRILDARTGAVIDSLPTSTLPIKIANDQTDRIYLATEGGTIECLREVDQVTPLAYNEGRKPPADEEPSKSTPKLKPKAEGGAPKVARDRPAPKKPAAKKDKEDADDAAAAEKPAKAPKGKAAAAAKGKAAGKGKKGEDAPAGGGDNPFGGN